MSLEHIPISGKQKSAEPEFISQMRKFVGPDRHYQSMFNCYAGVEDDFDVDDLTFFLDILMSPPNESPEGPYSGVIAYLRVYRDKPIEFIHSIRADWDR